MLIIRIWRFLLMLKRRARGHSSQDIKSTPPGALAVKCPACPRPRENLPPGVSSVPRQEKYVPNIVYPVESSLSHIKYRWLYRLHIAMDANFRLKNRLRSSTKADPGLITGLAYFVNDEKYTEHLLKYVNEEEVRYFLNWATPNAALMPSLR